MSIKYGKGEAGNTVTVAQLLKQSQNEQAILLCVAAQIAAARSRQDLWDIINHDILDLFNARHYSLRLLQEDGLAHYPFLYSEGQLLQDTDGSETIAGQSYRVKDGVFDLALASEIPIALSVSDILQRHSVPSYVLHWQESGITDLLMVRIINGHEVKGVLYLYTGSPLLLVSEKLHLLTGIANLLGTGICNILANEKIERQLEEINRYKEQLEEENLYLQQERNQSGQFSHLTGTSVEMQKVYRLISQVASSDATVLLLGETGTGKEMVAKTLHEASSRRDKLMIRVNCAAMPANLIESELFGHEKGSFTGATDRRTGKFELANNSTLFLDEIGELPLDLQVKLLRALQEKEIERVGGRSTIKLNVRIIAATNRNLEKEVNANRFRSDLFYRLNVFPIALPPLRKRKEDIPALVSFFIEKYARNSGKKVVNISHKAMESLMGYSWPGNIRELEHLIERTVLLTNGKTIREILLPAKQVLHPGNIAEQIRPLADVEREYILKALQSTNGRVSGPNGAARQLKLPSTTLISKMEKLGIRKQHFIERKNTDG